MEKKQTKTYHLPILVNLRLMPALVIGGGSVAQRKVSSLLEFCGNITVIAPEVTYSIENLAQSGRLKLLKRPYAKGYCKQFKIVFCATDNPETDKLVFDECMKEGILVNVADVPELCSFIMPATIKRGIFTVSFSSQGNAPFFTKEKKDQFDKILSPMVGDVAELATEFRNRLMNDLRYKSPDKRYALFHKFLMFDWEMIFYELGKTEAYKKMEDLFD